MLKNFFKLDGEFKKFREAELLDHLNISKDLRSILYEPDNWPITLKQVKSTSFTNCSLSKTVIESITFTDCKFEDCLFIGSHFKEMEFHRCEFINCNFYKSSFENCYIDPRSFRFDNAYKKISANIGVHLFQQLYENSSKSRQSTFEAEADIKFRIWKRHQLEYDYKEQKISNISRFRQFTSSFAYEIVCGFGYRPSRFIAATIILLGLMSIFNMAALPGSLIYDGKILDDIPLADSIFYTYSMMSGLGFSMIVPANNFAKLLTVFEALVGIGWIAIFTSLLVKRFIK